MSFATYTDLKASIAAWLARADLTTAIPDYIQLAEARFNRTLRARQMEARANITITGEYVTAPNDFLEFRSGHLEGAPRRPLHYLSSDSQNSLADGSATTASGPVYFSMAGGSFRFSPTPAVADAVILYYAAIPPMSLNATNWLLTQYPDAYLLGSILAAELYIQNDPRLPMIHSAYDEIVGEIKNASNRARWGGPAMRARAA